MVSRWIPSGPKRSRCCSTGRMAAWPSPLTPWSRSAPRCRWAPRLKFALRGTAKGVEASGSCRGGDQADSRAERTVGLLIRGCRGLPRQGLIVGRRARCRCRLSRKSWLAAGKSRNSPEQPLAAFGYRGLGERHEQECHEQYGKAGAASLSTLSAAGHPGLLLGARALLQRHFLVCPADHIAVSPASAAAGALAGAPHHRDRKSTRLNSSHVAIS